MDNIWIIIFINAQQLLGTAELPELEIPLCSIHIARTSLAAGSGGAIPSLTTQAKAVPKYLVR